MKKTLTLLLTLFITALAQAQVEYGPRYEQPHDWLNNSYLVISNEKDGVMLVQADFDAGMREYPIAMKLLNSDLEKVWEDTVLVRNRFFLKGYFYSEQKTYLMLQNNNRDKVRVLRIDALNNKIDKFESKKIAELHITEFEVVKNTAIIGGYFEDRPVVFAYDLEQDKVRTLQNVYQNQSELVEVKINKDSLTFNVLATVRDENRQRTIMVNTYDYAGNAIRDYTIKTKPFYELVNGVSSSINDIEQVVVGVYGYKTDHTVSGIYVNHVGRSGEQTMTYHNFGDLPKFLDYLGEKRAKKQRDKAASLKSAGKEHRYRAEVLPRELIEIDDKLVFTGEFFKLYSQNINAANANRYNRLPGNRVSDLYDAYGQFSTLGQAPRDNDFTHAYMLVMDQQGNLKWDDLMEIDVEISGTMQELGRFQWLGDKGAYMYYRDTELFMKLLDGSDENEMITSELELMEEGDEIRVEKDPTIGTVRWYDNHFLVYGVHHIKPDQRGESTRKVFFINKVSATNPPKASKLD